MMKNRSIASRILLGVLSAGLLRGAMWLLRGQHSNLRKPPSVLQRAHPRVPDTGAYTPTRVES